MLFIISYDIPDNKRRLRVAKALLDVGNRVQYSVFEARLDEARLKKLRARLEKLVDAKEDSIRLYRLCRACEAEIIPLGNAKVNPERDVYIL